MATMDVTEIWTVEYKSNSGWAPLLGVMVETEEDAQKAMDERIAQGLPSEDLRVSVFGKKGVVEENQFVVTPDG